MHETVAVVARAAEADILKLRGSGYDVEIKLRRHNCYRAVVAANAAQTQLEWNQDSTFRFFPVEPDPELGWRLTYWDVATNKVLAFCGRDKLRDWVDVLHLAEHRLCLGALVWAAAAKDPGLTPEFLLDCARRFGRFPAEPEHWHAMGVVPPTDLRAFKCNFLLLVEGAEQLVEKLHPSEMGCFYLNAQGQPVCPDPAQPVFKSLTRHYGSLKGAWPRIVE